MKLQDIKKYLNETRNWYIVLTSPWKEKKIREDLDNKGIISHLPTTYVQYKWKEKIRKIQIPTVNRCIFIYATDSEVKTLKVAYSILPLEMIKMAD